MNKEKQPKQQKESLKSKANLELFSTISKTNKKS